MPRTFSGAHFIFTADWLSAEDAVALDQASLELVVAQKVRAGIASAKLKSQDAPPAGQGIVSAIQYCEFKYFKP